MTTGKHAASSANPAFLAMRAMVADRMVLVTSIRGANLRDRIGTWSSRMLESVLWVWEQING